MIESDPPPKSSKYSKDNGYRIKNTCKWLSDRGSQIAMMTLEDVGRRVAVDYVLGKVGRTRRLWLTETLLGAEEGSNPFGRKLCCGCGRCCLLNKIEEGFGLLL